MQLRLVPCSVPCDSESPGLVRPCESCCLRAETVSPFPRPPKAVCGLWGPSCSCHGVQLSSHHTVARQVSGCRVLPPWTPWLTESLYGAASEWGPHGAHMVLLVDAVAREAFWVALSEQSLTWGLDGPALASHIRPPRLGRSQVFISYMETRRLMM